MNQTTQKRINTILTDTVLCNANKCKNRWLIFTFFLANIYILLSRIFEMCNTSVPGVKWWQHLLQFFFSSVSWKLLLCVKVKMCVCLSGVNMWPYTKYACLLNNWLQWGVIANESSLGASSWKDSASFFSPDTPSLLQVVWGLMPGARRNWILRSHGNQELCQ